MKYGDLVRHITSGYYSIVMSCDEKWYIDVWTQEGLGKWRRGNCDVIQDLEDLCR